MSSYNDWDMLNKAIKIAVEAHDGQTDKNGLPYILHSLRVMMPLHGVEEKICGVLHDIIEDTDWTLDKLRTEGFSESVIETLDLLTRRKDETYEDFIERILCSSMACSVKLEDVKDNMDDGRMSLLDEKTANRLCQNMKWLMIKSWSGLQVEYFWNNNNNNLAYNNM